jgi:GNAT superfamily N-acetyltransferase
MPEEIAQLSEAYLDATVKFIIEIRHEESPVLDESKGLEELPDVVEPYRAGSGNFWISLVERKVIGAVGLVDLGSGQGCLQKMYVHPDFRGTGTALRLLNTLIDWADSRQVQNVYLGTYSANHPARRFYEKHGFCRIPENGIPANFPRSDLEDCFYRRSLASG